MQCCLHFNPSMDLNFTLFRLYGKTHNILLFLFQSWHFLSYDRQFHGTSYKLINLKCMRPGLKRVKFTIGYFGSRHYSPNAWCQRITPKPPLPTTLPVTTVQPSTTSASTLVAITTDTSTTTLGTTPTTTTIPASTTTTTPVSITTTTTKPVSTTTESTTSTSTTPIPTPTDPGLPSSSTPTQSTTVTTTLGPGPVRPSPS